MGKNQALIKNVATMRDNALFYWIPAYAGMTVVGAGMTVVGAGMTNKMDTIPHYLLGFWVFPMGNKPYGK